MSLGGVRRCAVGVELNVSELKERQEPVVEVLFEWNQITISPVRVRSHSCLLAYLSSSSLSDSKVSGVVKCNLY